MHFELAIQIATLLSVLVGIIGIVVGIITFKHQMNAQVFLECTKRYEQIMDTFPQGARGARLALEGKPPPSSEELSLAVLRYLNLCSEEFYLCSCRYLSRNVWSIWEAELRRTVASPLLRREWRELRSEFQSYPDFVQYVEDAQRAQVH